MVRIHDTAMHGSNTFELLDHVRSIKIHPRGFGHVTLRYSNMAMENGLFDYLSLIFLIKPPFIGDFPLPAMFDSQAVSQSDSILWEAATCL